MILIKLWYDILLISFLGEHIFAEIIDKNYAVGKITWSGSLDQNWAAGVYDHLR